MRKGCAKDAQSLSVVDVGMSSFDLASGVVRR